MLICKKPTTQHVREPLSEDCQGHDHPSKKLARTLGSSAGGRGGREEGVLGDELLNFHPGREGQRVQSWLYCVKCLDSG